MFFKRRLQICCGSCENLKIGNFSKCPKWHQAELKQAGMKHTLHVHVYQVLLENLSRINAKQNLALVHAAVSKKPELMRWTMDRWMPVP